MTLTWLIILLIGFYLFALLWLNYIHPKLWRYVFPDSKPHKWQWF